MNKEEVDKIISGIFQSAANVQEFVKEETPLVVQELLKWKFVESIVVNTLCLLGGIAIALIIRAFIERLSTVDVQSEGEKGTTLCFGLVTLLSSIFGGVAIVRSVNLVWLEVWVAPKLYVLEYAAELVK